MEPPRAPKYHLEISADRSYVKDVVKGILHTIFFHRYFTPLYPATHDVLDITLPYVTEDDVETLVEQRTNSLLRQLESSTAPYSGHGTPARGQITVQFLERKRKKSWFGVGVGKADEETPWEHWVVDVTLTAARSEPEAARNRRVMERGLQQAALKIVTLAGRERNHIPPITTNEAPFPFRVIVGAGKGEL